MKKQLIIGGDNYHLVLGAEKIQARVKELAAHIAEDYADPETVPVLLIVLNGGIYFGADLSRALSTQGLEHEIDTIGLKAYDGDENGGEIKILSRPRLNLSGRDIVIVEDILDRGDTVRFLYSYFSRSRQAPRSVNSCVLCVKERERNPVVRVSYFGFSIKPEWVVGAGMDANGLYRGLPGFYQKTARKKLLKKTSKKPSRKLAKLSGEKVEAHLSPDFSDVL